MAGSASHVKHVRLAHIHLCAWCRSPLSVSTGFSSCTMARSASHVKHVRLAHIHHCAWWRSPAPCCDAPFTGPFSGDHQNMFLHLFCFASTITHDRQSVHDLAAESVRKHHRRQMHRVLTVVYHFLKISVGLLHSMARFLAAPGWLRSNRGNCGWSAGSCAGHSWRNKKSRKA